MNNVKIVKRSNKPVTLKWRPSPALIQGVSHSFGISLPAAKKHLYDMAQVAARMNLDFSKIPDSKILTLMTTTKNVIAKKTGTPINNNQGLA